ncbi:hypothetical protein EB796_020359 [Bugula neritina]|uniref:Protein kinase domain-containing protein n=1 Tax=Bugula neritina TaxID=10212 RepID=A0A7J7J618_BUGNE|nr:hypothetical protein EB796_020359 [Bugula neritina]
MTEVEAMEKLKHERIVQYIRHEEIADDRDPVKLSKTLLNCRSAGATMVEMLTKNPLWPTLKAPQLMYQIVKKEQPRYDLDPTVSSEAKEILDAVLVYDQERRPTAKQLLNHTCPAGMKPSASIKSLPYNFVYKFDDYYPEPVLIPSVV